MTETENQLPARPSLVVKAKKSQFAGVNVAAAIAGGIILHFTLRARGESRIGVLAPLWLLLVAWLVADWLWWLSKGVREIRLHEGYLELLRGEKLRLERHGYEEITDLHVHRRGTRRSLQILLGRKVIRVPGIITLYPGPKIWITEDGFDANDFSALVEELERARKGSDPS